MKDLKSKIYEFIENEFICNKILKQGEKQLENLNLFLEDFNSIEDLRNKKIKTSEWRCWSAVISYYFIFGSEYEISSLIKSDLFSDKKIVVLYCFDKLSTNHPFNITSTLVRHGKLHMIEKIKEVVSEDFFMKLRKKINVYLVAYNKNTTHQDLYYFSKNIAIQNKTLNFDNLFYYWEINVLLKMVENLMFNKEISLNIFNDSCKQSRGFIIKNLFLLIEHAKKFRDFNVDLLKLSCSVDLILNVRGNIFQLMSNEMIGEGDLVEFYNNFKTNIITIKDFIRKNISYIIKQSDYHNELYNISMVLLNEDIDFLTLIDSNLNKKCVIVDFSHSHEDFINHCFNIKDINTIKSPERFFLKTHKETGSTYSLIETMFYPIFHQNLDHNEQYLRNCADSLLNILNKDIFIEFFNNECSTFNKVKFPFHLYENILSSEFLEEFEKKFNLIIKNIHGENRFVIFEFNKTKERIRDKEKTKQVSVIISEMNISKNTPKRI